MPFAPLRPCTQPGCPALVKEGKCEKHSKQYERERGTSHERGYTFAWHRARTQFLREHPLCKCGAVATEVDHIVPHKGNLALFWDVGNWQALCKRCHSAKTAVEDGRWSS